MGVLGFRGCHLPYGSEQEWADRFWELLVCLFLLEGLAGCDLEQRHNPTGRRSGPRAPRIKGLMVSMRSYLERPEG